MRDRYYQYLVEQGYKEYTPSGLKSTVYSYCVKMNIVCEMENMTWEQLAEHIDEIIPKYDKGGIYEDIGNKSRRTCINALKAYSDFVKQL